MLALVVDNLVLDNAEAEDRCLEGKEADVGDIVGHLVENMGQVESFEAVH